MTIAVDFDGTIVEHAYPKIGKPIPFAIDVLKKLKNEGHILILWTVRDGELLKEALEYCEKNDLSFHAANKNYPEENLEECSPKILVDMYIDDRNIGGLPDWGIIYQMIKSGINNPNDLDNFTIGESSKKEKKNKNFFTRLGEALDRRKGYGY